MTDNLAPIIQLINGQFDQLNKRLDVMDAKNDQRDLRVNTMDAANKAEIAAVRKEIDAAKTVWKVACWIGAGVATFVGWAAPEIVKVLYRG